MVLVLFAGGMCALQIGGEGWVEGLHPGIIISLANAGIMETFYWDDFYYSPQQWWPF